MLPASRASRRAAPGRPRPDSVMDAVYEYLSAMGALRPHAAAEAVLLRILLKSFALHFGPNRPLDELTPEAAAAALSASRRPPATREAVDAALDWMRALGWLEPPEEAGRAARRRAKRDGQGPEPSPLPRTRRASRDNLAPRGETCRPLAESGGRGVAPTPPPSAAARLAQGETLLRDLYDDDPAQALRRRRRVANPLWALAQSPDAPGKYRALRASLRLACRARELGAAAPLGRLSVTAALALCRTALSADDARTLARRAAEEGWSAKRLREESYAVAPKKERAA